MQHNGKNVGKKHNTAFLAGALPRIPLGKLQTLARLRGPTATGMERKPTSKWMEEAGEGAGERSDLVQQ